jgi:hypothetical protein
LSGGATVPAAQANTFGNSNNNIPFSWNPTAYQQVFLGSEMPIAVPILGLGLRQDDQFSGFAGHTIDVEMWLGYTTYDHNSLTNVYATNATMPLVYVLGRKMVQLPNMPPSNPTNPQEFFIQIPFDRPFPWAQQPSLNLLIEVRQWGNSNNNSIFTFPLDAHSGTTTTRLYASGSPGATSGTLGVGYGHVMCFLDKVKVSGQATAFGKGCPGTGGPGNAVPVLAAVTRPVINMVYQLAISSAARNSVGILFTGASNTNAGGLPLPFDLAPVGAHGCSLLCSLTVITAPAIDAGGNGSQTYPLPNDRSLIGAHVYSQVAVLDTMANALGFAFTNGMDAHIGEQ